MTKQPVLPTLNTSSSSSQTSSKLVIVRNVLITLVSLALAALWIALGPHGDFINGRAFTVLTVDQVTYVFYNWTISLPLDATYEYHFQSWNTRLVGTTTFVAADKANGLGDPNRIIVNIETTARPDSQFSINPWVMGSTKLAGFSIVVDDSLPNKYGIDYANVIVYFPPNFKYKELVWNTYPRTNVTASGIAVTEDHRWNIHSNDLEAAGMHFEKVEVITDKGDVAFAGVIADEGSFSTMGGQITGRYTVPPANLHFNTSAGSL